MASKVATQEKVYIPDVPRERLIKLFKTIKPTKEYSGDGLHYITGVDIFNNEFLWYPVKGDKAFKLKDLGTIKTYHRIPDQGHFEFKPSIAEVLSQIPEEVESIVTAFRVIPDSYKKMPVLLELEALKNGYHIAETVLYARK